MADAEEGLLTSNFKGHEPKRKTVAEFHFQISNSEESKHSFVDALIVAILRWPESPVIITPGSAPNRPLTLPSVSHPLKFRK